jgi:hypothetical protein
MKTQSQSRRLLALAAALSGLLVASGCHQTTKPPAGDEFSSQDDSAAVRRIVTIQKANAARQDGMLYDNHFDAAHLNSLGESKLTLMLKDSEKDWPLVVYMDVPQDRDYTERVKAVSEFLLDAGLRDSQFRFEQGPNPHYTTLAAPNIQRVRDSEASPEAGLSSRPGTGGPFGPSSNAPAGPASPSSPTATTGSVGDGGK